MRSAALLAIQGYKRFVSPHKGFSCAYRVNTGGHSCSTLGYRAIRRYGLFAGLAVLQQRLHKCSVASRLNRLSLAHLGSQRGVCDFGCPIGCDLPACDLPAFDCPLNGELLNCCSASNPCDCAQWWWESSKKERREQDAYIPPPRDRAKA